MVADVQLYIGRSLDIVQQAESLGSYGADIAADYDRYTSAQRDGRDRRPAQRGRGDAAAVPAARRRAAGPRAGRARLAQHPRFLPAPRDGPLGLGARARRVRPLRGARPAPSLRRPARRPRLRRLRAGRQPRGRPRHGAPARVADGRATGRAWMPRAPATPQAHRASSRRTPSGTSSAASARSRTSSGAPVSPKPYTHRDAVPYRPARLDGHLPAGLPEGLGPRACRDRHGRQRPLGQPPGAHPRSRATRPARPRCWMSSPAPSRSA